MKRFALIGIGSISLVAAASAQVIYSGGTYTQDFNSLASSGTTTWTDNGTLLGWYSSRVNYVAGTGSSNTGALYSFGSTPASDRALGSVASGSTNTVVFGAQFQNNLGGAAESFTLQYTGEQWRNGGNTTAQKLTFEYSLDATSLSSGTWTAVSLLDFTGPIATATAGALDGNLAANRANLSQTVALSSNWLQGSNLWIRWSDPNDAGNDHGLGIDDLSFVSQTNPVPEPASMAALAFGAATLIARRRRKN